MFSNIINSISPWVSIITGVISLFTFLYVTVGGIIIKKKVVLHSIGPKPVVFRVQQRNYNVQQITNVVSARYFDGGTVPPHVRQEIIKLTAPTAMKELKKLTTSTMPSLFVNLTNHPSTQWDEFQLAEARKYGEIIDIPFPQVESTCGEAQIAQLAKEYEKLIMQKSAKHTPIVHIMGEMTFTYALVRFLRNHGIRCLASTTERVAETLPSGEKVSTFKFVRFRDYE